MKFLEFLEEFQPSFTEWRITGSQILVQVRKSNSGWIREKWWQENRGKKTEDDRSGEEKQGERSRWREKRSKSMTNQWNWAPRAGKLWLLLVSRFCQCFHIFITFFYYFRYQLDSFRKRNVQLKVFLDGQFHWFIYFMKQKSSRNWRPSLFLSEENNKHPNGPRLTIYNFLYELIYHSFPSWTTCFLP